jgi:flagellar hook assembly protein FlgD
VLDQNHPNPFNPSTTIRYALPCMSSVKLSVYDILGQAVSELVNEQQSSGWKEVQWNATVASGIYIYRMNAVSTSDPNKRFVQTKKMLLLR